MAAGERVVVMENLVVRRQVVGGIVWLDVCGHVEVGVDSMKPKTYPSGSRT
jgi:hypothetical protein